MSEHLLLPDRAVVEVTGEDRRPFLQGIITQDIERLTPESAIFSALLTPQGKILADFFVIDAGEAFLIDCDKANAAVLVKRLTLYKLRAKVAIKVDDGLCVIAGAGQTERNDIFDYQDPRHEALGWRAIAPVGDHDVNDAYDAQRISLGVAEFGKDFSADEKFLSDVNYDALNAVSYKKGCFIGQEVSSRMKRKGGVRRRTLVAECDGPAPAPGASVTAGDATLGEVMSGAANVALANVRLDRWEKAKSEGTPVECGGKALRLRIPAYLEQD